MSVCVCGLPVTLPQRQQYPGSLDCCFLYFGSFQCPVCSPKPFLPAVTEASNVITGGSTDIFLSTLVFLFLPAVCDFEWVTFQLILHEFETPAEKKKKKF